MKPKYLKQTRQPRRYIQRKDLSGTDSQSSTDSHCPETRSKDYPQEPSSNSGNYYKTKNKPKSAEQDDDNRQKDDIRHGNKQKLEHRGNFHTISGRQNELLPAAVGQNCDAKQENIISPFKHAVSDTSSGKSRKKKPQETFEEKETITTVSNDVKLSYQVDTSNPENNKSTCNIERRRDTATTSRRNKTKRMTNDRSNDNVRTNVQSRLTAFHSSKLNRHSSPTQDAYNMFDINEKDIQTIENSRDQKRDDADVNTQPRGSERSKAILYIKIPTSSADLQNQLLNDIYRTLVRVKGENLSLAEMADVIEKHARIHIDYNSREDFTSLFEQNEDKFIIAYRTNEPLISVKTDVVICPIFTNDPRRQHECHALHICKYFLLSTCSRKQCKFGHNLCTKHNKAVFRVYSLDGIEEDHKMSLVRNVDCRNVSTMPLICKFYNNEGGCKNRSQCTHLHICKNFIYGDCKFGRWKCIRCHNILSKQPMSILERYGLMPESYNYNKILELLKDTLDEGGVLLKKDIQPNRWVGTSRKRQSNNSPTERHESLSSSVIPAEESETSIENYSYCDDSLSESELLNQTKEYQQLGYDSASENTDEENLQTANDVVENGLEWPEEVDMQRSNRMRCNNEHCNDMTNDRHEFLTHKQDEIKSVMTFESQIENKQFRIRAVKGRWEIANKQGIWLHMDADESDRLSQLHSEFIRFAEKIISDATN